MFGIGGCEEVQSSIFWAQRRGKREFQNDSMLRNRKYTK